MKTPAPLKLILILAFVSLAILAIGRKDYPLIPRQDLFGNPEKSSAEVSPRRKVDCVARAAERRHECLGRPTDKPETAVAVTDDKKRGIRMYLWSYDQGRLVYMQDEGGDENWHVYAVDVDARTTKDLTPFPGVQASFAGRSRKIPGEILVSHNQRDQRYPDLFRANLKSGELKLVAENPGFSTFETDDAFKAVLASKPTPDGGEVILRAVEHGWEPLIDISAEDNANTSMIGLDAQAKTLFMFDSRGRNTAALTSVDLKTGATSVLAEIPAPTSTASSPISKRTFPSPIRSTTSARSTNRSDPGSPPTWSFSRRISAANGASARGRKTTSSGPYR